MHLAGLFRFPVSLSSCVPTVLLVHGTGISTSYPSATTFVLTLGPDLPWVDQLDPGNLRHSAYMILTYISLLIPAFSLPFRPRLLALPLRPNGMLLYPARKKFHSWFKNETFFWFSPKAKKLPPVQNHQ